MSLPKSCFSLRRKRTEISWSREKKDDKKRMTKLIINMFFLSLSSVEIFSLLIPYKFTVQLLEIITITTIIVVVVVLYWTSRNLKTFE